MPSNQIPSMSKDLSVQNYRAQDSAEILALLGNAWFKKHLIDWQFASSPGKAPLLIRSNNDIVAFNGVMPVKVWLNGVEIDSAWSCDFFVRRDCRRKGLGRALKAQLDTIWPIIMALGVSQAGQMTLLKAGWKPLPGPRRFIRILHGTGFRKKVIACIQRILSILSLSSHTVFRSGVEVVNSSPLPDRHEVDALWKKVRPNIRAAVVRDWNYLHWRFSSAPYGNYKFLIGRSDSEIRYIAVTRIHNNCCMLVDYVGPTDSPEIIQNVIANWLTTCSSVERLQCTTTDPIIGKALRRNGFIESRDEAEAFFVRDNLKGKHKLPESWFLMGGDSDPEILQSARRHWGQLTVARLSEEELASLGDEWDES